MDNSDWIEPAIRGRMENVIDACDRASKSLDEEYKTAISLMINECPMVLDAALHLNDLYFDRQAILEIAYRIGLADGLTLQEKVKASILNAGLTLPTSHPQQQANFRESC